MYLMLLGDRACFRRWIAFALFSASLTGCAGFSEHRQGLALLDAGQHAEGVQKLYEARQLAPGNTKYRIDWLQHKTRLIGELQRQLDEKLQSYELEAAPRLLDTLERLDPGSPYAQAVRAKLTRYAGHADALDKAESSIKSGQSDLARESVRRVLADNPNQARALQMQRDLDERQASRLRGGVSLRDIYKKPVTLEFRDTEVKLIFEGLSRKTGINFVVDNEIRPDVRATVFLKKASLEDALNLILSSTRLEKKILNAETVLIYPATPDKTRQYQDLVIRGFFLDNADAKRVAESLKGLLKLRTIDVDERLNSVIVRDTPEAMDVVQRLVAMYDQAEPEVLLEVEVLEIKRTKLLELGIQIPNQLSFKALPLNSPTGLTVADLRGINSSRIGVAMPNLNLNLNDTDSVARLLANPSIRVRNREKAKILIGDKLPVITTTTTSNGLVSENIQYIDVGLKLDVEPNVYLRDDVAIRVGLEVSSLVKDVTSPTGSVAYQIGTRTASTVLRIRDGETQLLAGLISNEERAGGNRIPGLGDLPILGRLFSSSRDETSKTEIVLSITPRIVRNVQRPSRDDEQFWIGTEDRVSTAPRFLPPVDQSVTDPLTSRAKDPASPEVSPLGASPSGEEISSLPARFQAKLIGPATARQGDVLTVKLTLQSNQGLRSLPVQLGFDPKLLQVVDVIEGDYFRKGGGVSSFSYSVDAATGRLLIGVSQTGATATEVEGEVATVRLRAIAPAQRTDLRALMMSPVGGQGRVPVAPLPDPLTLSILP